MEVLCSLHHYNQLYWLLCIFLIFLFLSIFSVRTVFTGTQASFLTYLDFFVLLMNTWCYCQRQPLKPPFSYFIVRHQPRPCPRDAYHYSAYGLITSLLTQSAVAYLDLWLRSTYFTLLLVHHKKLIFRLLFIEGTSLSDYELFEGLRPSTSSSI